MFKAIIILSIFSDNGLIKFSWEVVCAAEAFKWDMKWISIFKDMGFCKRIKTKLEAQHYSINSFFIDPAKKLKLSPPFIWLMEQSKGLQ